MEIFEPLISILGFIYIYIIFGGIFVALTLVLYSFIRSFCRYILKIDESIDAKLSKSSDIEDYIIVALCFIFFGFFMWRLPLEFADMASLFGISFIISTPFFTFAVLSKRQMTFFVKITLAICLLLCLLNLTMQDYEIIKYWALFSFGTLIYFKYQENQKTSLILYVFLACLFQPFVRIDISKEVWGQLDVIVSLGLIISLFSKTELDKPTLY